MQFKRYQSIKRFGVTEVEGIELGECYIFPKLDGANSSIWLHDGSICCGSRNRQLSLDNDNAGFMAWVMTQQHLMKIFIEHPDIRLYGEWLVPHSLKTYREEAWGQFYVFDVVRDEGEHAIYLNFDKYSELLDAYNIKYIPAMAKLINSSYDDLIHQLKQNVYLIDEGKGFGEGIVIKNYEYQNQFGKTIWAKIVSNEFKEKHIKEMGANEPKCKPMVEQAIAEKYCTKALVDKTYAKIEVENGGSFQSKDIPRLLGTCFHDVVSEDCWEFIKENKNPTINFRTLQSLVYAQVKIHSILFG